jgi:hypothetical protein
MWDKTQAGLRTLVGFNLDFIVNPNTFPENPPKMRLYSDKRNYSLKVPIWGILGALSSYKVLY